MYESDYSIWPATAHMISVLWTRMFMIVLCSYKSSMLLATCVHDMSVLTLTYLTFHRYLCKVDIYANVLLKCNFLGDENNIWVLSECKKCRYLLWACTMPFGLSPKDWEKTKQCCMGTWMKNWRDCLCSWNLML